MEKFAHLLSPLKIGNITFKNRMTVAPMGAGYGNRQGARGEYSDAAIEYMLERARGGFGLFFAGSLHPDYIVDCRDGANSFMHHRLDFKKRALQLTERASHFDMKMIQQISFGVGRNMNGFASCSENEVFGMPGVYSAKLSKSEIERKVDCMIQAAKLMKESGFVGVEIHAMHWGYLLDQFALSVFNRRTDEYGGALENRLRVAREIITGIKQECGSEFLVGMRMGLKSYINKDLKADYTGEHEAGRTLEESIKIAQLLEQYGYDFLDVNAGIYESFYYACAPLYIPDAYVLPLAKEVKKAVNIPVLCGSRMGDPNIADLAIANGEIDGVVLGRPSLADPHFAKKVEMGQPEKIRPCIGCLVGCMGKIQSDQYMSCAVNPVIMREHSCAVKVSAKGRKVAVIGGGVAGMEAARTACLGGHTVTVYEKSKRLGGLLNAAGAHDFKKEVRQLKDWYIRELDELNIPVKYNSCMSLEDIRNLDADVIIFAMGSNPIMPPIKGIDHPKCKSAAEALEMKEKDSAERIVVVGGGLVGCETAVDYAKQGKKVVLVEAAEKILARSQMIPLMIQQAIPDMLDHYQVKRMEGYMIKEINDEGAVVESVNDKSLITVPADQIIMSIGLRSVMTDISKLYGSGKEIYVIGDQKKVGNVYTAINSAYEIARAL